MTNYNDLKKLQSLEMPRITLQQQKNLKSHIIYDPFDFSFKFIKCRHENKHKTFNHIEINEWLFDDLPEKADEMIMKAIESLSKDSCLCINLTSNDTYQFQVINCKRCISLNT